MTTNSSFQQSSRPVTLGILGGGQLSRMLAESAGRMGIPVIVLSSEKDCPAARFASRVIEGDAKDPAAVSALATDCSTIIFENEFVDCDVLSRFERQTTFLPAVETLRILQNKLSQKILLSQLGIPTSPFIEQAANETYEAFTERAQKHFQSGCVLKWATLGYDGKGVLVLSDSVSDAKVTAFFAAAAKQHCRLYAEEKVSFVRECAIVAAFSTKGEFATYPLVISEQSNGICAKVLGPATSLGLSHSLQTEAESHARTLAEHLKLYGCFAIEFFVTEDGRLLVNEIAPRVHNSGHYTQNACPASQFENHVRAVLGLPLGSTKTTPLFGMANLLGPAHVSCSSEDVSLPPIQRHMAYHWYEKKEVRPGRKVGHINATGDANTSALEFSLSLDNVVAEWELSLSKEQK